MKPGARRLLLTNGLAAILAMSLSGCGQNTTNSQHLTPPPQPNSTPADPQVPLMGAVAPQQTMGEPSVCPPPNPRVEMGDVMYQPEPQELMGKVVAPPPKALEVLGQVVAPPEPPVIKGEVHIPDPAEKK